MITVKCEGFSIKEMFPITHFQLFCTKKTAEQIVFFPYQDSLQAIDNREHIAQSAMEKNNGAQRLGELGSFTDFLQ